MKLARPFQFRPDRAEAWLVDCVGLPEAEAAVALSSAEQVNWGQMPVGLPRRSFAAGRFVLRSILADVLRCRPNEVPIVIGTEGKPYLASGSGPVFNISHSWPFVLVALGGDAAIGADVEPAARRCPVDLVGRHVLTSDELRHVRRAVDRDPAFLALWTAKEAVAKASGLGLRLDFRSIALDPLPLPGARVDLVATVPQLGRWFVTAWQYGSAIAAVATEGRRVDLQRRHAGFERAPDQAQAA